MIKNKWLQINFPANTYCTVLELNLCEVLVSLKMRHITLFNHFHFFQNGLVNLQRGHIISKNVILNRTLNLGFQNFKLLVKECTFYRLHFFSFFIVLYVYLSWYFHFQHVLLLGFNNVPIDTWRYKHDNMLGLHF